jgi:glyoxylase-like metal-dependent hydrolase (beta-lactamase superfamily II)
MINCVTVRDKFDTNCYFYIDDKTRHGFLIDPGAQGKKLASLIKKNGWTIEKILLTHGHFDHIGGIKELTNELKIPVYAYGNADQYLLDTKMNLSYYCDRDIVVDDVDSFYDGQIISLESNANFTLQVIHTPGHTEDSCLFYSANDNVCFVGDTIFKGNIGSPNYPSGNMEKLQFSIFNKLFKLPLNTVLYSGHSESTTVANEIRRY